MATHVFLSLCRMYLNASGDLLNQLTEKGNELYVMVEDEEPSPHEKVLKYIADADIAIIAGVRISKEQMEHAKRLRLICVFGSGTDLIDIDEASRRGIDVVSCRGGNAGSVAELSIGCMISLSRNLYQHQCDQRENNWYPIIGNEISGKTLGILGMGAVGKTLAKKASQGFQMQVFAYDVVREEHAELEYGFSYKELDEIIKQADYLSIHLPLTKDTRHLLSDSAFAQIKPGCFLINLSRGGVVDEEALLRAIQSGKLGGAALDVFEQEPRFSDAFKQLSNVLLSPHIGGSTREGVHRNGEMILKNIEDVLEGRNPSICWINPNRKRQGECV